MLSMLRGRVIAAAALAVGLEPDGPGAGVDRADHRGPGRYRRCAPPPPRAALNLRELSARKACLAFCGARFFVFGGTVGGGRRDAVR